MCNSVRDYIVSTDLHKARIHISNLDWVENLHSSKYSDFPLCVGLIIGVGSGLSEDDKERSSRNGSSVRSGIT